jgi:hypothetical protein
MPWRPAALGRQIRMLPNEDETRVICRKCPSGKIRLRTAGQPKGINQSEVVVANTYMLHFRHNLKIFEYYQYSAFQISDRLHIHHRCKTVAKSEA